MLVIQRRLESIHSLLLVTTYLVNLMFHECHRKQLAGNPRSWGTSSEGRVYNPGLFSLFFLT